MVTWPYFLEMFHESEILKKAVSGKTVFQNYIPLNYPPLNVFIASKGSNFYILSLIFKGGLKFLAVVNGLGLWTGLLSNKTWLLPKCVANFVSSQNNSH